MKHYRPAPTSEEFLALLILLGPLAYVLRGFWRLFQELHAEVQQLQVSDRAAKLSGDVKRLTVQRRRVEFQADLPNAKHPAKWAFGFPPRVEWIVSNSAADHVHDRPRRIEIAHRRRSAIWLWTKRVIEGAVNALRADHEAR